MEHNYFGQTAQWLLQEASKHACNGAVQHVSFSDANVTVLVQFFQLPIHALPNERWSVHACGSACAVAILDWRTMSASDILATYIGFYEHAFHTVSRVVKMKAPQLCQAKSWHSEFRRESGAKPNA